MRRRILICIAACFYYSGLVALARWLTRRFGQRLVILNYHQAAGGDLQRHLLYLRRHYRIMHIDAALDELYTPRKQPSPKFDSRIPLVLTFDDGYRDNYTHAFALARELQIPISIYLVPGYIENGAHFWWVEGDRMVKRAQVSEAVIEGRKFSLHNTEDKIALAHTIDTRVRRASSVAERESFLTMARSALAVPSSVLMEEEPDLSLTWQQIQEMEQSGWVSFGAHTMHHPILAYLTDPLELQNEVTLCREILTQHLERPVRSFAYPVGQMQHISADVLQFVQNAGYDWALTTHYGFNTPRSNPFLLQRIEVDVSQHWLVMAAEAAGLWGFFSRLRWLPFIRKNFTNSR